MDRRVTAQEVIREIARNMEEGLEPLEYSVLAPNHFDVYLEGEDFRLLEPLFDEIGRQARKKLDERLAALNESAERPRRLRLPWRGDAPPARYERKGGGWAVTFCVDHEPDAEAGRITVHSYFTSPANAEAVAGARTKRLAPRAAPGAGPGSATRVLTPTAAAHARLQYTDLDGDHVYEMTKETIVVGRADPASSGYWADLQLNTRPDVSREHARVRRDAAGTYFIKDLSRFGTRVNGDAVPPSLHDADGEAVDRDVWVPLPARAEIDLAGVLTLSFEAL